jgi:hypothetical protein
MPSLRARRLLAALGFAAGLLLAWVVVVAVAMQSGAGWRSRNQLSKGDV